ncbi:UNVERIFIED_CONTAM: hypothetical protein Sindi_0076700 [Sesamum indicum]
MDPPKSHSSSSSLPAGDGETAGEAPADGDGDGTVTGWRKKNNHGRRKNPAARVEDEKSGPSPPAATAAFPPTEGRLSVPLGLDGRSTEKGGSLGAETSISNPTVGSDASLKGVHDDPEHTTVKNGGKAPATLPLLATVTVRVPTTATGGNGHFSCRPAILGGRKAAGNESAAARIPGALFQQLGEWTEPSPAIGDVCRKEDMDIYVDTTGADVVAEVGDEEAEVEKERVADISPSRADVIYDARAEVIHDARADVIHDARADVIHEARADVIHDARADVIHDARADVIAYTSDDVTVYTSDDVTACTTADVINPRADIIKFMGEKTSNLAKKSAPAPLFIGNIPLHTGSNGIVNDKIADAFNNSTRKTLSFIAPTKQNGEVVVRLSLDTVRDGSKR